MSTLSFKDHQSSNVKDTKTKIRPERNTIADADIPKT